MEVDFTPVPVSPQLWLSGWPTSFGASAIPFQGACEAKRMKRNLLRCQYLDSVHYFWWVRLLMLEHESGLGYHAAFFCFLQGSRTRIFLSKNVRDGLERWLSDSEHLLLFRGPGWLSFAVSGG